MVREKIHLSDAKNVLKSKLFEKFGNDAVWLPSYDKIADWLSDNKGKGLLLYGGQGVGKSFICTEIIPQIFDNVFMLNISIQTPFTLGRNLNYLLSIDKKINVRPEHVSHIPIVFDDAGIETPYTEYGNTVEPMVVLTYYAERNEQLLIITTNLNEKELSKRYGPRVLDRLKALCTFIEVKGNSFRK